MPETVEKSIDAPDVLPINGGDFMTVISDYWSSAYGSIKGWFDFPDQDGCMYQVLNLCFKSPSEFPTLEWPLMGMDTIPIQRKNALLNLGHRVIFFASNWVFNFTKNQP